MMALAQVFWLWKGWACTQVWQTHEMRPADSPCRPPSLTSHSHQHFCGRVALLQQGNGALHHSCIRAELDAGARPGGAAAVGCIGGHEAEVDLGGGRGGQDKLSQALSAQQAAAEGRA